MCSVDKWLDRWQVWSRSKDFWQQVTCSHYSLHPWIIFLPSGNKARALSPSSFDGGHQGRKVGWSHRKDLLSYGLFQTILILMGSLGRHTEFLSSQFSTFSGSVLCPFNEMKLFLMTTEQWHFGIVERFRSCLLLVEKELLQSWFFYFGFEIGVTVNEINHKV